MLYKIMILWIIYFELYLIFWLFNYDVIKSLLFLIGGIVFLFFWFRGVRFREIS